MRLAPGHELLDDPAADPATVRRSLGDIARSNRYFGGTAAVLYGVDRLLAGAERPDAPLTILDLGTGAGDIPAALRRWGTERGRDVRTIGLERSRTAAELARGPSLPLILGCLSALPIRTGGVDIVVLSQVLHHLDRESAAEVLRAAGRVARRGVVVADLLRSGLAKTLFGLAAQTLEFDHHTREDGMTSVARGYIEGELASLAAAAGMVMEITTRPGWRIVAWGRGR